MNFWIFLSQLLAIYAHVVRPKAKIMLLRYCSHFNVVKGLQNIIQGDSTETKWLLDHGYHASPSLVRSPTFQRQSAIYQKRSYNGMKKLESFQSPRLVSIINRTANQGISDQYSRLP